MKRDCLVVLLSILIQATLRTAGSCEDGWLSYDTECIRIIDEDVVHSHAHMDCFLQRARLVIIDSEDMINFFTLHLVTYNRTEFWVGSAIERGLYSPYATGSKCPVYNGAIRVIEDTCTALHGYICSRHRRLYNPTENCLRGLTEHSFIGEETGNCLFRTPGTTNFANAESKCAEYGGRFLDLDEIARDGLPAFKNHLVMVNDGYKYWTALIVNGTQVYWKNGKPVVFMTLAPGNGDCVTVSFNFTDFFVKIQLYQTDCVDQAHVVCAASPVTTRPPTLLPVRQQALSCPRGQNWKEYSVTGDCYWETSFETSRLSWDEARRYCQAFGGDLASFHSIDEEKIGLSFQYGSLSHPYWIGLRLDPENETYKWIDGSTVDYENWAPGHPDHRDKRLHCVSMDASNKHWESSLCGVLSWFVCKAAKRPNPLPPVIPIRASLTPCEPSGFVPKLFYYQGYCYSVVNLQYSWHRAKEYCENMGSSLASIHSDDEIGFLLRLLYDDKNTRGNRVWIGLNTLRNGVFRWTDWSPYDLTYWNVNEPNNHQNQEKCCNMYMMSGLWNDENCNLEMGFVCKQRKDATDTPIMLSTIDPMIGNCKKGWHVYHDRCYLPVGYSEKDKVNWTTALDICQSHGGYLVSIRNSKEQAFLAYLMQGLKDDAWIGLHDTIQSGRYYWVDNSDMQYTNWAPGEPSFFGIQEDCVKMVYNDLSSGVWRDDTCHKELPFICQTGRDPDLPKPEYNRGLNCIHPEGWLKKDAMCFKMFGGNPMSWHDAEMACQREGAHLVSIVDTSVQAVATYLGNEVNTTFWIGLRYDKSSQQYDWLNDWPMSISKWGKDNPPGPIDEDVCFAMFLPGYWGRVPCTDQLPFICQITAGKPPARKRYGGNCPKTSESWIPTEGSVCHLHDKIRTNWFTATLTCFRHGSSLISLHSLKDLEMVKKTVPPGVDSIYIGLMRNENDGFSWTDRSPVDFVNWHSDHPDYDDDLNCIEMVMDTLRWRVVPCSAVTHYLCAARKDRELENVPENAEFTGDASGYMSAALTGTLIGVSLIVLLIVGIWFFRPTLGRRRFRNPFRQQSISYENALYNVDSASMEFKGDGVTASTSENS